MTPPTETWLSIDRIPARNWPDLAHTLTASAAWPDDHFVFAYTESLDHCNLHRCEARTVVQHVTGCARSDLASPLEGRIFDPSVEARWRRVSDANWVAWTLRELAGTPPTPNHPSSGCLARAGRSLRRYYLLGTCDKTLNGFHEARYAKRFAYPIQDANPNDRAYIEVAEYRRIEPQWSDLSVTGEVTIDRINNILAQPPLFAHRFVRVGAGTDRKER